MSHKHNTYPAPPRFSINTEHIKIEERVSYPQWRKAPKPKRKVTEVSIYVTRPYTEADVLSVLLSGGWFDWNVTEFENGATASFARQASEVIEVLQRCEEGR